MAAACLVVIAPADTAASTASFSLHDLQIYEPSALDFSGASS